MRFMEFLEVGWDITQILAMIAFWIVAGAIVVLLFVEFVLGIDFIAWIVGDPIGDILSWMREIGYDVKESLDEKKERIEDSYNNS